MENPANDDASDESLMARYASGDAAAFDRLFERYEARIYRFMRMRTGSEARAADLYQELFLRIHCVRAQYDSTRPFAPWLFQIARHLLIDEFRRRSRRPEVEFEETAEASRALSGELPEAERRLAGRQAARAVLEALSETERYVLIRSKLEGCPYAELALELGKSVLAIKKLASRAMLRLRGAQPSSDAAALPIHA
jgi:RNA polymerase sigma factor (sigma-70 family)